MMLAIAILLVILNYPLGVVIVLFYVRHGRILQHFFIQQFQLIITIIAVVIVVIVVIA